MKFSTIFAIFSLVSAVPCLALSLQSDELEGRLRRAGPNARRMALGLPPVAPTRSQRFKRAMPSAMPPPTISCATQTTVCCASLEASNSTDAVNTLTGLRLAPTSANVGVTIGIACVVPLLGAFGIKSCIVGTAPASCCSTLLGVIGFSCTATTSTVSG
ncbi:hypothetical protein DFH07DRAFT_805658 [Mycena maculata]|uniref:Hydrophobin n=1 Tax=Mycena maculata TaxID=230809 RepID=A0AAD7NQJ5_9AGAR|nr:hypothetical protein DFH07DRAFT_805658 [Mycena maculata]